MIDIIHKPEATVKRVFHCPCGCVFQGDVGDYEVRETWLGKVKYIVTCPYCKVEQEFTDKNSEYKYIHPADWLPVEFREEDSKNGSRNQSF